MNTPVRAAVIGCGAISKEHLSFLSDSPLVDLVGVCDLSEAARRYAAERYGARAAYGDLDEMLATAAPEVVHVLTPPKAHKPMTVACLEAGAHVICEKPIAHDVAEFDSMVEVADRHGLMLIESQNLRFNDVVLQIKDLIERGELGEVLDVEVRISLDIASGGKFGDTNLPSPVADLAGGAIHDFLPHMAYGALQFVPDGPISNVHAVWRNLSGNETVGHDELDAICNVGDARIGIRFSSVLEPHGFRLYVRGTRGQVETDAYQPYLRVEVPRARGPLSPLANQAQNGFAMMRWSVRGLRDKVLQHGTYHGMPRMLEQFYRSVRGEVVCPIRPQDIRRPLELVDAVVQGAAVR